MSSVAPLGCTIGAATGVPSSLGVELDPVFAFPAVEDAAFFFLERVIVSFDPLRRTAARVAVDPLSLEGDWRPSCLLSWSPLHDSCSSLFFCCHLCSGFARDRYSLLKVIWVMVYLVNHSRSQLSLVPYSEESSLFPTSLLLSSLSLTNISYHPHSQTSSFQAQPQIS